MIKDRLSREFQDKVEKIVTLLAPYTKRAFLVGGCVRDMFLNHKIRDLDIEVYDIKPDEFDSIMKKSGALGVGKSFFVYKLDGIDLSLPRIEKKVGVGHKAFEVEITDDEKLASKRRDFSMNAMMINIFTGKLLDYWDGYASIEAKKISLIDEVSFKEDSLRVLRAVQFSSRLGFEIDKHTLRVMQDIDLKDLSKTRIFWELEKLFNAKYLDTGFVYMYRLNLFEKLFSCKVDVSIVDSIRDELKSICFVEELKKYYFFYIVANMLRYNPKEWLRSIEAPKQYLRVFKNQPFTCRALSDRELLKIAIDMPIKEWLGNYKEEIQIRAKELGIWENCFSGGVKIQEIIEDGFAKEEIKKEYRRRVMEKIDE